MHFYPISLGLHNIPNSQSGSSSQELWKCFLFTTFPIPKVGVHPKSFGNVSFSLPNVFKVSFCFSLLLTYCHFVLPHPWSQAQN
jgi:hypothetical protein